MPMEVQIIYGNRGTCDIGIGNHAGQFVYENHVCTNYGMPGMKGHYQGTGRKNERIGNRQR